MNPKAAMVRLLSHLAGTDSGTRRIGESEHALPLEARQLMAAVAWDGGGNDNLWSNPLNWDTNALPGAADTVTINAAGSPTIRFTSAVPVANRTVSSLDLFDNLLVESSVNLAVSGSAVVRSGAAVLLADGGLQGGAWDVTAGTLRANASGGDLRDVNVTGDLTLDVGSGNFSLFGSTRFAVARLAATSAALYMGPGYVLRDKIFANGASSQGVYSTSAATITMDPSAEIRLLAGASSGLTLGSGSMTLVNNGLIANEAAGRTMTLNAGTLTNRGAISSTGSLTFGGSSFTNDAAGSVSMTGPGTLTIQSTTWSNAGNIVVNDPANGAVTLTTGGNWASTGTITVDNATVNFGGTFTTAGMNLPGLVLSGSNTINLTGTLNNAGSTLTLNAVTGTWVMRGGEIRGGTLNFADATTLTPTGSGGILRDLQVNGDLTITPSSAYLQFYGSTRFGTLSLAGSGAALYVGPGYVLQDRVIAGGSGSQAINMDATGTFTVASGAEIRLAAGAAGGLTVGGGNMTLINNGLIRSLAAGRTLTIGASAITNNATIDSVSSLTLNGTNMSNAPGATIRIAGSGTLTLGSTNWTNAGDIVADDPANGSVTLAISGSWSTTGHIRADNATVEFGGTFTLAAMELADFVQTGTNVVNITGTLINTGTTLTLNATLGSWNLRGGEIRGGTLAFADGQSIRPTVFGGILRDLLVNGDLAVTTASSYFELYGNARFGTMTLLGNSAGLYIGPGYTLHDKVYSDGSTSHVIYMDSSGSFTIAPEAEIRMVGGASGSLTLGSSSMTLTNHGLIASEASGRTLTVSPSVFTNIGTVRVAAGTADLRPNGSLVNSGSITVDSPTNAPVTLSLASAWSSTGSIAFDNATVNLGGTFTTAGMDLADFIATGANTINITGTLSNAGGSILLNNQIGSWTMRGGEIRGGTLGFADGRTLRSSSSGGTLRDLQIDGDLTLDGSSAYVQLYGTTRFGTILLTASSVGVQTGPGYVLRDRIYASGSSQYLQADSSGALTIESTGEVRLLPGSAGGFNLGSSGMALTNHGLISCEAGGRTFSIRPGTLVNSADGVIRVLSGTVDIQANTSFVSSGLLLIDDPTNVTTPTLTLQGAWSNSGAITLDNATLNLGGTFSTAGIGIAGLTISGTNNISITGVLNNAGNTLTLNAATGSWSLRSGEIQGGTVEISPGRQLRGTNSGGTLRNVQVNGDLTLDVSSSNFTIAGSTRWGTANMTGSSAVLYFAPGYTVRDRIVSSGGSSQAIFVDGNGTLTIDAQAEILQTTGANGTLTLGGSMSLINNGIIRGDAAGRSISISCTQFTNNGTVQVTGSSLVLSSTPGAVANFASGTLTGGTWRIINSTVTGASVGAVSTLAANVELVGASAWSAIANQLTQIASGGRLSLSAGKDLSLTPAGGVLVNNGTINLGAGSTLAITGAYTQTASGTLDTDINGTSPAANIGLLTATGVVSLGGTVKADITDNYIPPTFTDFTVISGSSRSGTFAAAILPAPGGLTYTVTYTAGTGRITSQPGIGYWTGLGDGVNWTDSANWTGNIIPGPADSVVIDVPGSPTIRLGAGAPAVRSIQSAEAILVDGGTLALTTGASNIGGALTVNAGVLSIPAGTSLNVDGAVSINGSVTIAGTFSASGGGAINPGSTLSGSGSLAAANGTFTLGVTGSGSLALTIAPGATLVLAADQSVRTLTNNGTLDLSDSTIIASGAFTMSDSSQLKSGISSETRMGNIVAPGVVTLRGELTVYSVNDFDPSYGNVLTGLNIVRASARLGEFNQTNLPSTAVGAYALRYRDDRAELIFNIADFNGDGGVDGGDIDAFFAVWESGLPFADINSDGGVDGADVEAFITIWEAGGR